MGASLFTLPCVMVSFTVKPEDSEDTAVFLKGDDRLLLAAFDGCGGSGGRRYQLLENRTGAYIASRLYAACLEEWWRENASASIPQELAKQWEALFTKRTGEFKTTYLDREPSAITGRMVRVLPSTAAIALVDDNSVTCCWAGDSRCYLLSATGLHLLTHDDLMVEGDEMENLYNDSPMSNCLCADRAFELHQHTYALPASGVIIVATDGAFAYLPSPIHFEALLLDTLGKASSGEAWGELLEQRLTECVGDDVTLLMQPFGFQSHQEMKRRFASRGRSITKSYIQPANQLPRDDLDGLSALWKRYKAEIERSPLHCKGV